MHTVNLKVADLPLPSVHCGGYHYARESQGFLDGVPVPQERIFSKGPGEASAMLDGAPVGALYVLTTYVNAEQDSYESSRYFGLLATGWVEIC